ncbi:dihydroxyacetone kinase subunit DhaL [Aureimonas pseudogalii]|uniref:Dihydroxyacetone kinase-like protein n=1 Tax=Aureimonas pseudogalii TaxID=1744844 RepID=A0A7W6H4Y8_9HYPH|nr:dihydroxyacetone kinase subunit DhaL [Aureimonas pseudogalii]MBB3998649.1 dihydroxyacetone kinase-like protein [Aureimonas pseudogalii]
MQTFLSAGGGEIVLAMAARIVENKACMSEIGDGDHGVNMAKGFGMAAERLCEADTTFDAAMTTLGKVLMGEIGGSMGPLYGMMVTEFAEAIEGRDMIDPAAFSTMPHRGLEGVQSIGSAEIGDKTLVDTLAPTVEAFDSALAEGRSFAEALDALTAAAEVGRDSTIDLVACSGRAGRLGERSRGVLDAGATFCAMILTVLAEGAKARLSP